MTVVVISEYNIEAFADTLGEDLQADLDREFYRGLGAVDEDGVVRGVLVYELIGADDYDEDTKGVWRFLSADCEEAYLALDQAYRETGVEDDEITETGYEFEDERSADTCARVGFSKEEKESGLVRLSLKDAAELAFIGKMKTIPYYIVSIGEVTEEQYRAAIKNCLFTGQKGILEDLGYLKREWFDDKLSTCIITDNEISGFFLVRKTPSGILMPVLLYGHGADYAKNIAFMLALSIKLAQKNYPPETGIVVRRTKKATYDLMKKLFPRLAGKKAFFGSRTEEG